jgi:hypothetical protein
MADAPPDPVPAIAPVLCYAMDGRGAAAEADLDAFRKKD